MRGVRDGEADVRHAHRLEPLTSAPALLPRREQLEPQRAEPFPRDAPTAAPICRRNDGRAPCATRRAPCRPRAASAPPRPAPGSCAAPPAAAPAEGRRGDSGRGVCGPAGGRGLEAWAHRSTGVDNVNISGYIDVDSDNITGGRDGTLDSQPLERAAGRRLLWRTDAPLTGAGLLLLAALAVSLVGLWVDPRTITGAPAWLKPAKFAISTAIYTLTLAWIFTLPPRLDQNAPRRRLDDRRGARARSRDHRRAGVARHHEPLQRRHAARPRRFRRHGPGHRGADADERRGRGRALAPARSRIGRSGGRFGWD